MVKFIERPLRKFVASRFLLLPAFCSIYYLQLELLKQYRYPRRICLLFLLGILTLAIPANYFWIADFRKRLESGFNFLKTQTSSAIEDKDALDQMKWCNVQVLGIVIIILGILSQYQHFKLIPPNHRVPVLTFVLLIMVALFDAILELQAEWNITVLGAIKRAEDGKATLPHAIWKVNQYHKARENLYNYALSGEVSVLKFNSFPAGVQNMISFAMIIVFSLAAVNIALLWQQL
jgi:hypothetical protein